jgi:hypothetical protein
MGTRTDQHPFAAADTPSFFDMLDRVTADEQLDPRRKADLRSAIKSLAQWLGSDLTAMPAHQLASANVEMDSGSRIGTSPCARTCFAKRGSARSRSRLWCLSRKYLPCQRHPERSS